MALTALRAVLHQKSLDGDNSISVFSFDDAEGKAYVNEDADAGEDCVDEAIASCPAECITKE
jgi:ferredoxin